MAVFFVVDTFMCMCLYVRMYVYSCIYVYVYAHVYLCTYVCVCVEYRGQHLVSSRNMFLRGHLPYFGGDRVSPWDLVLTRLGRLASQ